MRKLMLLPVMVAMVFAMSVGVSPASASTSYFCGSQKVNNSNKCWGASRSMTRARAYGTETGVCVGIDTTQGTCAPTWGYATVSGSTGVHSPWIIGTSSNFTVANGEADY